MKNCVQLDIWRLWNFDNELAILKGKELYKEEYGLQMDVGFGDAIFG